MGWAIMADGSTVAVYDYDRMIAIHVAEQGDPDPDDDQNPEEIAAEDISFNTEGAGYGPGTPIVLHRLCRACGLEGDHGNPCGFALLGRG